MEFLKRKHFSLWITIMLAALWCRCGFALQGVPTWLCLGIKSPFIEFRNEVEVLSNASVNINITKDEYTLMHEKGLQSLGTFIKPIDLRNSTSGYTKPTPTKKMFYDGRSSARRRGTSTTENPIVEEMNQKEIELIQDENQSTIGFPSINNEDQKYIIPMALKNPEMEPKKEEFSSNIDDLKNHILMLQNLTENDRNFQSRFVVFPHLQRNATIATTTTTTTTRRPTTRKTTTSTARPYIDHSKSLLFEGMRGQHDDDLVEDVVPQKEKITIVPQVLLLNDQTPPDDDVTDRSKTGSRKDARLSYARRRNFKKTSTIRPTTVALMTTTQKPRRNPKRNKNKRLQNCQNVDTPRCQRQKRRQLALQRTKTDHDTGFVLSRSVRSHNRRNAGTRYDDNPGPRNFIIPIGGGINANNQSAHYKETVNLDPELCYTVDGMTYSQQKLCHLHTNIMPAISRGARSAIQECKHQFKSRRWNCSTIQDETVFGPTSSIGSPEMAFIHALAAATTTSFIARACRDGQLASCGCSRSSRPKQLADDWTWGGCGDDLEFAYKFSQNFIDIREKERKRGPRGLVSVPPKHKMDDKSMESPNGIQESTTTNSLSTTNDTNQDNGTGNSINFNRNDNSFKSEDLLELQEKITKEILNSKLQEKEMLELQEKINRELLNSRVFNMEHHAAVYGGRKPHQRNGFGSSGGMNRIKNGASAKARSLMNLHNNEAGRRAVIKKTRITCKCHGVSGSCSLITCWQQLSSIREIGDYLREKYDEATQVRLNKRGRLQVRDTRYKIPTVHDLVYLEESPDWCRNSRGLQWPGTHGRICNKTSAGLDGCVILCCGRGYNTKKIVVRERCNCKFHWCCHVKCETCVKVTEEHTCK